MFYYSYWTIIIIIIVASRLLVIGTITVNSLGELLPESSGIGVYNMFSWHYMIPPMDMAAMIGFMNSKQIMRYGVIHEQ